MPRNFWFFSIRHAAQMMNMIPGKYKGSLTSPFMLVHGPQPTIALGFLYSLSVTFATQRMATPSAPKTKSTRWMESFWVGQQSPTLSWSTTPITSHIISRRATRLTHIGSQGPFIRPSNMTAENSALCSGTPPPHMMNYFFLERVWNVNTQLRESYKQSQ